VTEAESVAAVGIVLVPLLAMWVLALFHIVAKRSDLSIGWKAIWSATVLLIPFIGVLIYVFVRPSAPSRGPAHKSESVTRKAIDEIHGLIADHESGSITDDQFASRKAAVFGLGGT
jgi:MFS family permease